MNSEEMKNEELTEEKVNASADGEPVADEVKEETSDKEEKSELDIMTEKHNEVNDKYLRLYSEFDNFRKRTQKEKLELYKTAGEDVISALLPVMDDFERAMNSMDDKHDVKSLKEGVDLIYQKLRKTLEQKGLKAIESPVGKEFDVEHHEAIANVPAPDKKLKGKIIDQTEKGYMLNDKVIRYTKVVIGE